MTVTDFDALFEEIKSWDRWSRRHPGHPQPAHTRPRRPAAAAVRSGRTVTLSLPVNTVAGPDTPAPSIHYISIGHDDVIGVEDGRFATDFIGIDFHGE